MSSFIDMTGWVMSEHGVPDSRWTVLYRAQSKNKRTMWHCKCQCGAEKDIRASYLLNGKSLSCGCYRKEKLHDIHTILIEPGSVFGHLTVLGIDDNTTKIKNNRYTYYRCRCDCEQHNIITVSSHYLKNSSTPSCGCVNINTNIYKLNIVDDHGLYGIGYCSNTENEFYFDMDDYDKIKDYYWREHVDKKGYHYLAAEDKAIGKIIRMQWLIVDKHYDHADRNALNNRKYNLRQCTTAENNQNRSIGKDNTSRVIGVYWHKKANKWCAFIMYNKNRIHLGTFVNKDEAIKARLNAEKQYFGEFAPQKHLYIMYDINVA